MATIINGIPQLSQVTVLAAGTYPKDGTDFKSASISIFRKATFKKTE
ncbi:hypothetical protein [uncultured Vagococcus sp.]|nr:hypothetical protein [uncultured Vagococcus sp.]